MTTEVPTPTITGFLTGRTPGLPRPEVIRRARLGAYVYARLPAGTEGRDVFRRDYLSGLAQHHARRAELVELLRVWHASGIEVLLFKGFALAEWVYRDPGQRPSQDVDVLVRPGDERRALSLAREAGWRVGWDVEHSVEPHKHEVFKLLSPKGYVAIDAHRRVLHSHTRFHRQQARITGRVWEASVPVDWQGARVRLPSPEDTVVVGLALQRGWGDHWRVRPHDYADFEAVIARYGVTSEALDARARELGVARSWRLFRDRCDPFWKNLSLAAPTFLGLQALRWRVLPERPVFWERPLAEGLKRATATVDVLRELPGVLRVNHLLKEPLPLDELMTRVDALCPRRGKGGGSTGYVVRGVHHSLKFLRIRQGGDCLPRALAIYAALRRRGDSPTFCSGVRIEDGQVESHAWIELDGKPVVDWYELPNGSPYKLNFAWQA
ncbi:lasso peptide biosynthesis B2 protein [Deinococcus pimensis]|uniref:lasso peptide biosynthesis B2 protein n=1 Tax=Deinococcus pimensis TaxID=309888 RepID=UPI0004883662|nr:lasso peptide biosynthesis B2 protein [Deinococcus pimensis]